MPAPPLLVYDGDCGFCRAWIARWRHATGERVEYAPYQEVAPQHPGIPLEAFRRSVQLIEPDGSRCEGAEAVFRALAYAPGGGWPLRLYRGLPGFAAASEACYRAVASHRGPLSRLTRLLWGAHLVPPGHALTAWIFLRLLAVVYGIAFVSLGVQVLGLVGHDGVLPAADFLRAVREQVGPSGYWDLPTLCWLDASDRALVGLCVAGTGLSVLLAIGIAPVLCLAGLWLCYLSLAGACQIFLWFQWDSLLLETGALAILIAPWRLWSRPGRDPEPPAGARWLLRWLLFRLMLSSAAVKLMSGDPTWRHLTALEYHYQTQPLPPWTAWYAQQLPAGFQRLSAAVMFAIEGGAPFLLLGPRRVRFAGGAALVFLQLLIVLTGNYGFFNLLSLALCVPLLDDAAWPWRWRRPAAAAPPAERPGRWRRWALRPAVAGLLALSLVPLFGALQLPTASLGPIESIYRAASPLHLADPYGLFAVM
ncbi:MAG TPA: lipase maturation factor family protein, partial [Candidatus Eisenbacteria bacterium]